MDLFGTLWGQACKVAISGDTFGDILCCSCQEGIIGVTSSYVIFSEARKPRLFVKRRSVTGELHSEFTKEVEVDIEFLGLHNPS
jgi:hypothetical protein